MKIFKLGQSLLAQPPRAISCVALKSSSSAHSSSAAPAVKFHAPDAKFPADEYDKNGFFVVKKLVSDLKLDKYAARFRKICEEKIKVPLMTVMKDVVIAKSEFLEGEKAITKIQDFCQDDELFEFCCLNEIVNYVKHVTGPNIMAMHTMLINKPPGIPIITMPHK